MIFPGGGRCISVSLPLIETSRKNKQRHRDTPGEGRSGFTRNLTNAPAEAPTQSFLSGIREATSWAIGRDKVFSLSNLAPKIHPLKPTTKTFNSIDAPDASKHPARAHLLQIFAAVPLRGKTIVLNPGKSKLPKPKDSPRIKHTYYLTNDRYFVTVKFLANAA